MPTYKFVRDDLYAIEVKARNRKQAKEIIESDNKYLNNGEFLGSNFNLEDELEWRVIFAEDGDEFQTYVYKTGKRVKAGTPIGIERGTKLILLRGIYFG